jgi:hypothetical protein
MIDCVKLETNDRDIHIPRPRMPPCQEAYGVVLSLYFVVYSRMSFIGISIQN